jgi:hypothetical protein
MELSKMFSWLPKYVVGAVALSILLSSPARAQEALCAEVQITISQNKVWGQSKGTEWIA